MKQFLVTAYDGTDEGALARRMAVRPGHQAAAKAYELAGKVVAGGPMLDAAGKARALWRGVAWEARGEAHVRRRGCGECAYGVPLMSVSADLDAAGINLALRSERAPERDS